MTKVALVSPGEFRQSLRTIGLSQTEFAILTGTPRRTVVYWAQDASPSGMAATLVRLLLARPELVEVLREQAKKDERDDNQAE